MAGKNLVKLSLPAPPGGALAQALVRLGRRGIAVGQGLEHDLREVVAGEVRFDVASRGVYAVDASNYRQVPVGVVIPRTLEDVEHALAVCRRHHTSIACRGGGTSLAGQCCNVGVILDFSKYLRRVLEVNVEEGWARAEPGVVRDDLTVKTSDGRELVFGPDPATHGWCTVGGMIGNNACGVHAQMAGRTDENVYRLEVLTGDGIRLSVGPTSEEELAAKIAAGGREGALYAKLRAIRDEYAEEIRLRYPRIPRPVSGYNLPALLPEQGFDVGRALVGSEGTCVTLLEAKLRLVERPPVRALVVIGYRDVFAAADHVVTVLEAAPIGLEAIDERLVELMRAKGLHVEELDELPAGHAWLLVELGGETKGEVREKAEGLKARLQRQRSDDLRAVRVVTDEEEQVRIWRVRESALGATARTPGAGDSWPGWEDASVAPEELGVYLRAFSSLLGRYGYSASLYGHFGQGCVHCRIDFDLTTEAGIHHYRSFVAEAAELVVASGGSFSGEHGDGQARGELLPRLFGPRLVDAMKRFKRAFDPEGLMNPGKVIDPRPLDEDLRLGALYSPWEPKTARAYPEDNDSFARATLRCVGIGRCRRADQAFMCPSYIATLDEVHTTRGRAHLLHEMVTGELIRDRWDSEAVLGSLDLCLGCKGCKKECPVGVDLATYRSEFLYQHYRGKVRPRAAYAMGFIERWARLAQTAPHVANALATVPPFGPLLKAAAGIAQQRHFPTFAARTASEALRKRKPIFGEGDRGGVVLLVDVFHDHFYPRALLAAAAALEALGYAVVVPPRRPPAARPLLHFGFLEEAKVALRAAIGVLAPYVAAGARVVGIEPSTVSVFRDDLVALLPGDDDARRVGGAVRSLPELLLDDDVPLPTAAGEVLLHEHCHQKAVLLSGASKRLLERMGRTVCEPEPGCCGMAGAFGFEANHFDISMTIAEKHLLPAVRAAGPEVPVVVEGFSCREQIAQGTGRTVRHLAELLAEQTAPGPHRVTEEETR